MKICIQLLSGGIVHRGAEHSMLMLAEDLAKNGHTVTVFQAGPGKHQVKLPFLPTSHKPTTFVGKLLERLYLDKRSLLSLIFSLKTISLLASFDVIIPTDGFWEVMIAKLFKKPEAKIICVGLSGIGWTDQDTLGLYPDIFVALSSKAAAWAKEINPEVEVVAIPLQVDQEQFQNAKPATLSLQKPIVLTVAALTKYKRVDLVIRAVANIPGASLLIIGQGEEKQSLQALCQKELPGRFEIRTAIFDELPALYKTADSFVLLSEPQEAFGQVLLEAMAADLPIVTTDDSIRREIVGESGIFVDAKNSESVTHAIERALGRKSQKYNLERFDRQQVAKHYEAIFKKNS